MPKVTNTRTQRAFELLRRMRDGPSLGFPGCTMTREEASEGYRIWVRSWILYEIIQLVPELRALHKRNKINIDGNLTNEKNKEEKTARQTRPD